MTIQWFPGHMAKARREVTEKLKLIDIVYELVDARIPMSSRNPMIEEILKNKPRIMLLNKADKADAAVTAQWKDHFQEQGIPSLSINSVNGQGLHQIVPSSKEPLKDKFDKMKAKGIRPRAIRALIIGIPNVGKSTLINRLAKKNIAKTGDRPGITTSQQWVKVGKELEPPIHREFYGLNLKMSLSACAWRSPGRLKIRLSTCRMWPSSKCAFWKSIIPTA